MPTFINPHLGGCLTHLKGQIYSSNILPRCSMTNYDDAEKYKVTEYDSKFGKLSNHKLIEVLCFIKQVFGDEVGLRSGRLQLIFYC